MNRRRYAPFSTRFGGRRAGDEGRSTGRGLRTVNAILQDVADHLDKTREQVALELFRD